MTPGLTALSVIPTLLSARLAYDPGLAISGCLRDFGLLAILRRYFRRMAAMAKPIVSRWRVRFGRRDFWQPAFWSHGPLV